MNTYRATVRVSAISGTGTTTVWAQVQASNPNEARQLLQAQYGHGNVISIPQLTR